MAENSDKPLTILPAPVPVTTMTATGPERRRSVRYPFTASANLVDLNSQTRLIGRSSDLCSGGCYIDTLGPFPVGTAVRVRLEREARKFEAVAIVTYTHQAMGMGMAFTDIKPEHQSVLNRWLAELRGEPVVELDEAPAEVATLSPVLALQQILNDLISLMIRKKAITEDEGTALLRQIFR